MGKILIFRSSSILKRSRMNSQLKKYLIFCLILFSATVLAQQTSSVLDKKVTIKPGKYKVNELIDLINASNDVHITYNNKTFSPGATVTITQSSISVKELLDEIQKISPIDY